MYCNNCGEQNPHGSHFCQKCGIRIADAINNNAEILDSQHQVTSVPVGTPAIDSNTAPFPYVISLDKFIFLSIATFGLYQIYWFYKQWKSFMAERHVTGSAWAVALFAPLCSYSIFKTVSNMVKEYYPDKGFAASWLAVCYISLSLLYRLPNWYYLLGTLSVLPLLFIQKRITLYWEAKYGDELERSDFSFTNFLWFFLGALIWFFLIYSAVSSYQSAATNTDSPAQGQDTSTVVVSPTPAQLVWNRFTAPSNQFSVLLPGDPKHESQYYSATTYPYQYDTYEVDTNSNETFLVLTYSYTTVSFDNVSSSLKQALLTDTLDEVVKLNQNNILVSASDTVYNGQPAKDFVISNGTNILKGRMYVVGNTIYTVLLGYDENGDYTADYTRFIDSVIIY